MRFLVARSAPLAVLLLTACTFDFDAYAVDTGAGGATASSTGSTTTSAQGGSGQGGSGQGASGQGGSSGQGASGPGGAGQGGAAQGGAGQGGMGGGQGGGGQGGAPGTGGGGGAGGGCTDLGNEDCEPWWDPTFGERRLLKLDTTGLGAPLTDFPWLVVLDSGNFDHADAAAMGADLRFVSFDGTTTYAHDVERWNASGTSHVWVRIPALPAEGTTLMLWMYYGNASASAPAREATWNSGFVSVHHLNVDLLDATSGNHDGTAANATAVAAATGRIAGGRSFDGTSYVTLPNESDYDFTNALSVSLWVDPDPWSKYRQVLVGKGGGAWNFVRSDTNSVLAFQTTHGSNSDDFLQGSSDVTNGGWHHVAIVYDGANKRLFVDGVQESSKSFSQTLRNSGTSVALGENLDNSDREFDGVMDEVRISNVARSQDWMYMEYRNVLEPVRTGISTPQLYSP